MAGFPGRARRYARNSEKCNPLVVPEEVSDDWEMWGFMALGIVYDLQGIGYWTFETLQFGNA
jgi:hypothetical protein